MNKDTLDKKEVSKEKEKKVKKSSYSKKKNLKKIYLAV